MTFKLTMMKYFQVCGYESSNFKHKSHSTYIYHNIKNQRTITNLSKNFQMEKLDIRICGTKSSSDIVETMKADINCTYFLL